MSSRLSLARSEFASRSWAAEPSVDAPDPDRFPITRPSLGRRALRVLITFCIGVAATLAWQSYGNAVREMVANSSPQQFGWLAPAAPIAQAAPATSGASPPNLDQLAAISRSLTAVRQSVDQLAAGQQQMTREITKLQATKQDTLDKTPAPPPTSIGAPARKPVPLVPPVR
jgi:hypothetical protein